MDVKDLLLDWVPPRLLNPVLPRLVGGRTPFLPQVLAREVIFIHVPKAAGSSLKTEIYGAPGGGHRRIAEFAAFDLDRTRRFFKCGFVRNPWDRLMSAYFYLRQGEGTSGRDNRFAAAHLARHADFEGFVRALEDPGYRRAVMAYDHFRTQSHWICYPGQTSHALDFLGRFERFDEDLAALRSRLGLPERPAPRARPSRHPPYQEVYTPQSRDIVARLYAPDIALLGYRF